MNPGGVLKHRNLSQGTGSQTVNKLLRRRQILMCYKILSICYLLKLEVTKKF